MTRSAAFLLLCVVTLVVAGDRRVKGQGPALVFTHVTVIAGTDAAPQHDQTVVIANGRIRELGPAREVPVPAGATVIDATGKFLIPGLIDMHVHSITTEWVGDFFPLFIANGITTVRDMFGDLTLARQLRTEIATAARLGPRFITPGPILDGPVPVWQGSRALATAMDGREAVRSIVEQGADFAKVYSRLPREAYFGIAGEAKRLKIPFAGHVPTSVSAAEASDAGQRTIEHLSGMFLGTSDQEDTLRAGALAASKGAVQPGAPRPDHTVEVTAAESHNPTKARALFARFVRNNTWQVPTLVIVRLPAFLADPDFVNDPRLKYVRPSMRKNWQTMRASRLAVPGAGDVEAARRLFAKRLEMVGAMHRAGVRILAGSDTPNPYVFPGFSLHDELALLVQAGLTPLEALQATTRSAAEFLGTLDQVGTVERGKRADLVLLDASPLEDIRNTQKIRTVIVGGRLVSRAEIDSMLAKVEAAHAGDQPGQPSPSAQPAGETTPLAVQGATLIDVRTGQHVENSLVVIERGRISAVGRLGEVRVPANARILDARSRWIIPGLIDSHAHAGSRPDLPLGLYLANGVTTIRDPGGTIKSQIQTRADIDSGKRVGPRLFFAGAILDGSPPVWPASPVIDTPEAAERMVRSLIEQGADFIKVYNNITEPVLAAIIRTARAGGVVVTGHVPRTMTMTRAVEMGLDRLEHIRITGRELLTAADADRIDPLPLGVRETLLWERFDLESSKLQRLIALLVEKQVFLDPTIAVDEAVFMRLAADQAKHPNNRYLRRPPVSSPSPAVSEIYRIPPELEATAAAGFEKRLRFIGMANRAGVQIVAGTDGPGLGTLLPGFGLHHELGLLVRAGLSPLQAIRAATITAARALDRERDLGTIEVGKFGDLVILDADPRQDIRNASRIRQVIKGGHTFEPATLLGQSIAR